MTRAGDGPPETVLVETLGLARRLGFIGAGSVEDAIAHSCAFVEALAGLTAGSRVVDLGSGGGLPGLVVASSRRDLQLLLIDRREKRTDFLARAVARLDLDVEVRCDDVARLTAEVGDGITPPFHAVTARSFGPPADTMRSARALLAPGGRFVVSEPPSGDRWDVALLEALGATGERMGGVTRFTFGS